MMRWLLPAVVVFLLAIPSAARADYLTTKVCDEDGGECALYSDNFFVNYKPAETTDVFANHILVSMELAYARIFNDWQYALPGFMQVSRLTVYIRDTGKGGTLGLYKSFHGKTGHIVIALEEKFLEYFKTPQAALHAARASAGHELFHAAQATAIGFGRILTAFVGRSAELRWLIESTAAWSEQHIFRPDESAWANYGYFFRHQHAEHWRIPLSGTTIPAENPKEKERTDEERDYEASSFIQYLTENDRHGVDVVRSIFDRVHAQNVINVWDAISGALEDEPWGETTRRLIGEFAVAALVRAPAYHADLSFDQLKPLADQSFASDEGQYDAGSKWSLAFVTPTLGAYSNSAIAAVERDVFNLAFDYVELTPFGRGVGDQTILKADGSKVVVPAMMRSAAIDVAVAASGGDWAFYLVEIPVDLNHKPQPGWTIRELVLDSEGVSPSLRVGEYGEFHRVVVVAANLRRNDSGSVDDTRSWRLFASVVEPLVVTNVLLRDGRTGETLWSAERSANANGVWSLSQPVTTGLRHIAGEKVRVEVRLDGPAQGSLAFDLGGVSTTLTNIGKGADEGTVFAGEIALDTLAAGQLTGEEAVAQLAVAITGADSRGAGLDARPETLPALLAYGEDAELLRWEGGGIDRPGGPDTLSGLTVPFSKLAVPPHAVAVRITQEQNGVTTVVYDAAWKQVGGLSIRRLDLARMGTYDPALPAEIEVVFSQIMDARTLEIALEGVKATVSRNEAREVAVTQAAIAAGGDLTASIEGTGYYYTGTLPAAPQLAEFMTRLGELVLAISGKSEAGMTLDHDPSDQAYFDWVAKAWSGYRPEEQAIDRNHKLSAAGRSFVLLLDASRSMADDLRFADAKAGVLAALQAMQPGDQAALMVFYDCNLAGRGRFRATRNLLVALCRGNHRAALPSGRRCARNPLFRNGRGRAVGQPYGHALPRQFGEQCRTCRLVDQLDRARRPGIEPCRG
jgi:hypothetical protein